MAPSERFPCIRFSLQDTLTKARQKRTVLCLPKLYREVLYLPCGQADFLAPFSF
jgi:hypothetical protein